MLVLKPKLKKREKKPSTHATSRNTTRNFTLPRLTSLSSTAILTKDLAFTACMGDQDDRKSDDYEMDMEMNPSDFLEMSAVVSEEDTHALPQPLPQHDTGVFQHRNEQHEVYVCSLCNKAFSSKGHLSLHARIHVGAGDVIGEKVITDDHTSYKRPYQCDLCNKSYSTAKHRWGHVSTTHRYESCFKIMRYKRV